jgi:hypothetical protein
LKIPEFYYKIILKVNKIILPLSLIIFVVFIGLMAVSCEFFGVSLTDYLQRTTTEDSNIDKDENTPLVWVYMAAVSGNDSNSGRTPADPVKTLGKALEIWMAEGSAEARIMLTEDIKVSGGYADPETLTGTGLVDFSTNLLGSALWPGIASITLAGLGSGKTIDNENGPRPVIYIGTIGKSITLKNLTITGGNSNGAGICIKNGAALTIAEGVIVTGNNAPDQGGGVYVDEAGSRFTMTGGEIHGNKAFSTSAGKGGGVCVGGNGTFIMEGGIIRDNESGNDGGGVYVYGSNSKVLILNGIVGGSSAGDKNRAKYGAGVYVGTSGSLELGIDGAAHPYPYIRYNESSGGGTGGGIVINGSGAGIVFHHGTVSNNNGAALGGGILIVHGKLDIRGGTVTENSAAKGPGITVENEGLLVMSKAARVLNPANPVHLYGTSPTRWITIGSGGFDYTGNIAIVTTEGFYAPGTEILKLEGGGSPAAYCDYFKVDNKDFGTSIDGTGKIKP